jgi:hypothetical protein
MKVYIDNDAPDLAEFATDMYNISVECGEELPTAKEIAQQYLDQAFIEDKGFTFDEAVEDLTPVFAYYA